MTKRNSGKPNSFVELLWKLLNILSVKQLNLGASSWSWLRGL